MTEDAAAEAGVSSPVGFRWSRHAGGVNPELQESVSGRYLSSGEREDIALWRAQAQAALFRYIDGWYNSRRIQGGLDGLSPDEYEAAWQARQSQPHSATLQPEGAETR